MRPLLTGTRVWSRGTADASTTADCADRRLLPAEVRQTILAAKREHPPLNVHEPTTIRWARCDHRPSSHTGKRILAESPPPPRTHRRFPPYHAIADPSQRRLAIVRLLVEGWNAKSIAAYLETSRQTVHATLKRWAEEEFAGMPDKSRAPHRPATKVTLRAMTTVKELQENPLLGEFRNALRPRVGSGRVCAVPAVAGLCRARLGRGAGGGVAVCRAPRRVRVAGRPTRGSDREGDGSGRHPPVRGVRAERRLRIEVPRRSEGLLPTDRESLLQAYGSEGLLSGTVPVLARPSA